MTTCDRCRTALEGAGVPVVLNAANHVPGYGECRQLLCGPCFRDLEMFLATPIDARCQEGLNSDGCTRRATRKLVAGCRDGGTVTVKLCQWHVRGFLKSGRWRDAGPLDGAAS
jgi:hypothetical protein